MSLVGCLVFVIIGLLSLIGLYHSILDDLFPPRGK